VPAFCFPISRPIPFAAETALKSYVPFSFIILCRVIRIKGVFQDPSHFRLAIIANLRGSDSDFVISNIGIFGRKDKAVSPTCSPAPVPIPAFRASPDVPSPPPAVPTPIVSEVPRLSLRVVVDPVPVGTVSAGGLFYITVDPDADVSAIRRAISDKLGTMSMGIFKVCISNRIMTQTDSYKVGIPCRARSEAREYTERYEMPVDLIAIFPAYNLDDPEQLVASLGPAGWKTATERPSVPRVQDWWPQPVAPKSDLISVLVRVDSSSSSGELHSARS